MALTTITEALAELKTIDKRLAAKRAAILAGPILARQEGLKDPLDKEGGSREYIRRERQAITDLETRKVKIRTAIQAMNQQVMIVVEGESKSIAEWLTWRKEVAPGVAQFNREIRASLDNIRKQCQQKGLAIVSDPNAVRTRDDVLVNIDEAALAGEIEKHETILGTLDGLLSLKNATQTVDVP